MNLYVQRGPSTLIVQDGCSCRIFTRCTNVRRFLLGNDRRETQSLSASSRAKWYRRAVVVKILTNSQNSFCSSFSLEGSPSTSYTVFHSRYTVTERSFDFPLHSRPFVLSNFTGGPSVHVPFFRTCFSLRGNFSHVIRGNTLVANLSELEKQKFRRKETTMKQLE